jgi:micrococcal nuclease
VATGYAKVYIYGGNPFRYAEGFQAAQVRAKAARRGLWGPPCNGNTTKPDPSAVTPPPFPPPPASPTPPPSSNCDPNYTGCVPPYPPDVDCADVDRLGTLYPGKRRNERGFRYPPANVA